MHSPDNKTKAPATLSPFPSSTEAFKDFHRNSLPPPIPRYIPEVAEPDEQEPHVIRPHPNLLAFQPRTRQRVNPEEPEKKKPVRRKRKMNRPYSDGEPDGTQGAVANDTNAAAAHPARPRSARRAAAVAAERLAEDDPTDQPELSDDDDFM